MNLSQGVKLEKGTFLIFNKWNCQFDGSDKTERKRTEKG